MNTLPISRQDSSMSHQPIEQPPVYSVLLLKHWSSKCERVMGEGGKESAWGCWVALAVQSVGVKDCGILSFFILTGASSTMSCRQEWSRDMQVRRQRGPGPCYCHTKPSLNAELSPSSQHLHTALVQQGFLVLTREGWSPERKVIFLL